MLYGVYVYLHMILKVAPPDDAYYIQANICFRFNYKDD